MPGMGMASMDMPTMFGGFGMQGMGGMNSNMMNMLGMNGMNGMMGMDFNGGFDGWNNGQQMGGGFGASSGFFPNDGGYNQSHQGHFPQMSHQQQYPKNNFHNQNRFQGSQRGGYGRGYHNQANGQFHNQPSIQPSGPPPGAPKGPKAAQGFQSIPDAFHHQTPHKIQSRQPSLTLSTARQQVVLDSAQRSNEASNSQDANTASDLSPTYKPSDNETETGSAGIVNDELMKQEQDARSEVDTQEPTPAQGADTQNNCNDLMQLDYIEDPSSIPAENRSRNGGKELGQIDLSVSSLTNSHNQIQDQSYHTGTQSSHQYAGRGGFRGGLRGRAGRGGPNWQYHGTHGPLEGMVTTSTATSLSVTIESKGTGVQGAPKGPKAMREGLPNTGWIGRGRGGLGAAGRGGVITTVQPAPPSDRTPTQVGKSVFS